jgi:hypothetical protein
MGQVFTTARRDPPLVRTLRVEREVQSREGMSRLIVRRRPDGMIQLRRRRAWHVVADPALLVLLGLCAACVGVIAAVTAIGIEFPPALAMTLPLIALGLWAGRWARSEQLAPVPRKPPPPPRLVA